MRNPPERANTLKPLRFLDAAHNDLMDVPEAVRQDFGFGLYQVQRGEIPNNASPFGGLATPQHDIETVQARYKRALELYAEEFGRD